MTSVELNKQTFKMKFVLTSISPPPIDVFRNGGFRPFMNSKNLPLSTLSHVTCN